MREFYVCSYGGCGSKMLVKFLSEYGNAYHIHDRWPPKQLTHTKIKKHSDLILDEHEWNIARTFTDEKNDNPEAKVIFIYSYPEFSLTTSCAWSKLHWDNIGITDISKLTYNNGDTPISKDDYLKQSADNAYYIEFYENYMRGNVDYDIIAINFHKIWDNIPTLENILKIDFKDFPEPNKNKIERELELMNVYKNLRKEMDDLPGVHIVKPTK